GRDRGLHLEPGFQGGLMSIFDARVAYAITQDFSAGGGIRIPRAVARGCAVEGRPLRREAGRALLPEAMIVGRGVRPAERQLRAMHAWSGRASSEWASAPAFCELQQQLVA